MLVNYARIERLPTVPSRTNRNPRRQPVAEPAIGTLREGTLPAKLPVPPPGTHPTEHVTYAADYTNRRRSSRVADLTRRAILVSGPAALMAAAAQAQPRLLIGYLGGRSLATDAHLLQAAKDGLRESGFIEGQNVAFEYRWAEGKFERLDALAAELVARQPDLIIAVGGTPVPFAAKKATSTLPIIFITGIDPVAQKLVDSLARPGGQLTGAVLLASALEGKRLQLLKAMNPDIRSAALLVNPTNAIAGDLERDARSGAAALGMSLEMVVAANVAELDRALSELTVRKPGGLAVAMDGFLIAQRRRIVAWAARERMPAIFPSRDFTDDGGLASYAPRWAEAYRWVGVYAGRNPARRPPGRPAGPAADRVRTGGQPEDRADARPPAAAGLPGPRRRGHRVANYPVGTRVTATL